MRLLARFRKPKCKDCYYETRCEEHFQWLVDNNPSYQINRDKPSWDCFIEKGTSAQDVGFIETIRHVEMHHRLGDF
jgi:hypothetical protein